MGRMTARVLRPPDVVISVPHSGTRSLVDHLKLKTHTHFRHKPTSSGIADRVHIPIRHPMDVAASWASREKPIGELLESYELMFEYLSRADNYTLYHMESMPRTRGLNDRGKRKRDTSSHQQYVMDVVREHRDFFAQFYASLPD